MLALSIVSIRIGLWENGSNRDGGAERPCRLALTVADHQDVAVLDDVFLALQTELALVASAGIAAEIDQRFPVHHFGANELLFEIGVNNAGGLHRSAVHGDGPGAALVVSGGEEAHRAQ